MEKNLNARIVMEFITGHKMTRVKLMKRLWAHYRNVQELDDALEQLQNAGIIVFVESQSIYVMPQAQIDEFTKYMKRI